MAAQAQGFFVDGGSIYFVTRNGLVCRMQADEARAPEWVRALPLTATPVSDKSKLDDDMLAASELLDNFCEELAEAELFYAA